MVWDGHVAFFCNAQSSIDLPISDKNVEAVTSVGVTLSNGQFLRFHWSHFL